MIEYIIKNKIKIYKRRRCELVTPSLLARVLRQDGWEGVWSSCNAFYKLLDLISHYDWA